METHNSRERKPSSTHANQTRSKPQKQTQQGKHEEDDNEKHTLREELKSRVALRKRNSVVRRRQTEIIHAKTRPSQGGQPKPWQPATLSQICSALSECVTMGLNHHCTCSQWICGRIIGQSRHKLGTRAHTHTLIHTHAHTHTHTSKRKQQQTPRRTGRLVVACSRTAVVPKCDMNCLNPHYNHGRWDNAPRAAWHH